jgi:hypothetical protein
MRGVNTINNLKPAPEQPFTQRLSAFLDSCLRTHQICEPNRLSQPDKSHPLHDSIFSGVVLSSEYMYGSVAIQQPAAVGRSSSQQ